MAIFFLDPIVPSPHSKTVQVFLNLVTGITAFPCYTDFSNQIFYIPHVVLSPSFTPIVPPQSDSIGHTGERERASHRHTQSPSL